MFRNVVGGLFFALFIFFSAFFGAIFMMGPILPLFFFKPSWFRWINDKFIGFWLHLPSGLLEILFGMKVHITREDFATNFIEEKAVIIMNHRTRLDWLYFWSVIMRHGKLENEKIILKQELKHIPGAGWAMQVAMFIFLHRRWEKDEHCLQNILKYFIDTHYPLQLLLFPEGTNVSDNTLAKSQEYAKKKNLPMYKHVLHPRLRGFTYCVEQLRKGCCLNAIYDVTVGYHGNISESEFKLLMGNFPKDVHFHIKQYPISSLPKSTEGLEEWCAKRWSEKEELLNQFYNSGRFFSIVEEKSATNEVRNVRHIMTFWIFYWVMFLSVVVLLLYHTTWVRWFAVIVASTFFLLSTFGGGLEMLQAKQHSSSSGLHCGNQRDLQPRLPQEYKDAKSK